MGVSFLLLLVVGVVAVFSYNFARDIAGGEPLTSVVAESMLALVFTGVVGGAAVWLWNREWSGDDTLLVGLWAGAAMLLSAFTTSLGVVHRSLVSQTIEPFVHFSTTTVALVAVGTLYGISRVRQRQRQALSERLKEQELQEQRESFERLVENVEDYAIFRLDAEGRVRTWNRGARELKGYDADDIVGESFARFYPESAREARVPERNLAAATRDGRVEDEGWRVRKDGSRFWARVVITALDDGDGDVRGYIKVTRDLTERREYERRLEHERERLAFLNRLLRHNLLNGLNLVNARTEILEAELAEDADAQRHLQVVQDRVMDMSELIDAMRTLMDAIVSEADHDRRAVPLGEVLQEELALARDAHEAATFEVRAPPDAGETVVADELLGEVFENLFDNAVVHNDREHPEVEVWTTETTSEVTVDEETGELVFGAVDPTEHQPTRVVSFPAVTVHVRDDGPGIPPDQRAAVFDDPESTPVGSSHGFGLHLVRELVEAYGGEVTVSGAEPRGTEVSVTLLRGG
ncbi:MAG: PAS domain S-box protein [Halorientalis sp.]